MPADELLYFEESLRLFAFVGVLVVMAVWELVLPKRPAPLKRLARWPWNLGIVAIDALVVRLVFTVALGAVAALAANKGYGLLNRVTLPDWLAVVASILVLDLVIYAQHVAFHKIPVLWRLHRMHHTDPHVDVTTGLRFHPLEILISQALKIVVVLALGAPVLAVVLFEILLNATSMFNHGNVRLARPLDRLIRLLVVTPDMHRVHHSDIRQETDSNFGFNLSIWDRLFGTYRAQPSKGHDGMTLGLGVFREAGDQRLDRLLVQPFLGHLPDDDGRR